MKPWPYLKESDVVMQNHMQPDETPDRMASFQNEAFRNDRAAFHVRQSFLLAAASLAGSACGS